MAKASYFQIKLLSAIIFVVLSFSACTEKDDPIQLPSVTTLSVTQITSSTALSGGSITNDGGSPIIARGVVWAIASNPSLEQHNGISSDGAGEGLYTSNLSGLDPESDYFVRAYATNSAGTAYGNEQQFKTSSSIFVCGTSTIKDNDGNTYSTVLIGNQCWMKENLKTTKYRNNTPIEYPGDNNSIWESNTDGAFTWYDNDISWKDSYGALYNWHAVNNSNGLCPNGWHIPSDMEWSNLISYFDPNSNPNAIGGQSGTAGGKLKSKRTYPDTHPRWNTPNSYATNSSDFSGYPGSLRRANGTFSDDFGNYGIWWSSTLNENTTAYYRDLYHDSGGLGRSFYDINAGLSVRCIKDSE